MTEEILPHQPQQSPLPAKLIPQFVQEAGKYFAKGRAQRNLPKETEQGQHAGKSRATE